MTPHKVKRGTIEHTALYVMSIGWEDAAVLRRVKQRHPGCKTTIGCIKWYRHHASNDRLWL